MKDIIEYDYDFFQTEEEMREVIRKDVMDYFNPYEVISENESHNEFVVKLKPISVRYEIYPTEDSIVVEIYLVD